MKQVFWVFGFLILIVAIFGVAWMVRVPAVVITKEEAVSVSIPFPIDQRLRQGINECGPYSAAAAIAGVTGVFTDPREIVASTKWRLPSGGTLPWGMTAVLKDRDLSPREFTARHLSYNDRMRAVVSELQRGHPVILLGRKEGTLHYITVLGYDRETDTFHLYDSWYPQGDDGHTIDDNGAEAGNRTLSRSELLSFWQGGGAGPFYRWYGIAVASSANESS